VRILQILDKTAPECVTQTDRQGRLALHLFTEVHQEEIMENDREAECLRYLLRRNPAAVRVRDRGGHTPLDLGNPDTTFVRRRLLLLDPTQGPAELRRLNYAARRMGVFLAFAAINADGIPNIFSNARSKDQDILRIILSYL
jgi:hypothetical protein